MIDLFSKMIKYIVRLPAFFTIVLIDFVKYIKNQQYKIFDYWGLHIYVGKFGAGKTSSMVQNAYKLAKRYKQLTILTNLKLTNFPTHTQILQLDTIDDIVNSPDNCLVLIDEIGTLFNSRDFKRGDSVPKILFQYLCQCRKRHLMVYGTCQRWGFLDKQLRDITDTVRVSHCHFIHPFSRICTVTYYDAFEYDKSVENPMIKINSRGVDVYLQTDKIRRLYDTIQMVSTMLKMQYDTDEQILQNRGETQTAIGVPLDRKQNRQIRNRLRSV